jgi:two-component system cell cycle sensor histidine kinase/response regulator CckA
LFLVTDEGNRRVKAAPTFEDIFAVMSTVSVGGMAARVAVPDDPQIDDMATKFALALNILLDDLALKAADAKREVAERARLAARLQMLADASHEFSAATGDLRHLLDVVARRLGEAVGDLCVIRTLTEDGEWLEPGGAVFHVDADLVAVVQEVALAGRQRVGERVRQVISTAQPVLIPKTDTATFATTTDRSYAPFLERFNVASSLTAPLLCRGRVVGIASLLRSGADQPYEEDDVRFVQSLADHAALAIANARSYAAERSARDAAEKATARFARLSEAGLIGIVVIDLDGRRVLDINDTLLHLLAYSRDELVYGRVPWASLTPPEWCDVDALAIEQLTTSGVAGLREKEFIRKDGRHVSVLAGSAMLGGGTTECISFVLDLTARKEAERGRREAERRAQRIVESAMVGMWTVDAEGRTNFMNARMAHILGLELAEALVTPIETFFLVEDRPTQGERLASRRAGVAGAYEQRFRKADGTVCVLWIEGSPMYDAQGRYEGVLGVVTDITERHRAEEAMRASETRYRLMFDNSPLPKWMYDAETLRFLDVNEATLREYGYSREEFLSMTIKDIRPPEDVPALLEAERQVELHPKFGVCRLRKKSGEIIQVELTKHTFTLGDRVTRLAVGRDVTERLRLEEQLRQSQKMEAVGRLAGGVAHDFNNVLSVILSYGDMLIADMKPGEPMRDDVEEIRKAGYRAADLTRQLLMFSRQQVIEPKVLDLNEVLTSMDKMLQRILGADVDLVSLPTQPLGRVRADPSSVEQVIMNLVVNARDAMPTGGQLTMETGNVVLDEAYAKAHLGVKPGPHVMLAVTDTGTGIDNVTQSRIFEPFFTTKEKGKGTGLGLSTVFGIVQQSGGSVWIYSEVGKGTTFKVYLPRVDDAVDVVRTVVPPETLHGSETVLLVEDDDQVRTVARGILGRGGYHVIEARNAGEALLHSEKYPGAIHLLLSDVVMPQMSGPELAKRLASSRPEMKVLCMSGYTDDSIVRHGVLEARIAYLQKPITPETLTTKVRELLDGSKGMTTEGTR